jgi:hypothetical protein
MSQKVMLIDDLDQSEGAETIRYSVDGKEYEIDLSEKNAQRFRDALKESSIRVGKWSSRRSWH